MKIKKVRFSNYRNVPNIEKELNGSNIILLADNTIGKSNFIKGIIGALTGKFGNNAIAHGKEKSEIEVEMADFTNDWQPITGTEYMFRASIKKGKGGEEVKLEVIAPNGLRETRKTMIGSLAGELTLDYNFVELSRTKAGKAKQLEIIKSYLDEETRQSLRVWESKIKAAYDDRTEINRKLKYIDGFIKEQGINPDDIKKYNAPVNTSDLLAKRDQAMKVNESIRKVKDRMNERIESVTKIEAEIKQLEERIEALRTDLIDISDKNSQANKWLEENKPIDTSSIDAELISAEEHNKMHERVKMVQGKLEESKKLQEESGEYTALIDSTRQAIQDAIREMQYPIPGISFDEENVYFNGKSVDENNMSTAEIMMLEAQLKMCKAPGASVLFIERGESLGSKMLEELQKQASEKGFQIILEQVERDTQELKIEMLRA